MAIIKKGKFEHQMPTQNPFVICMHHLDYFPEGDENSNPKEIKRENEGFNQEGEWRMYYGKNVPGFPAHPHRGFETVTVVMEGIVDHTDGMGSRGRYGNGDVQWMTAGSGLQHCEMFPLVHDDKPNTLELFQVWLSLDSAHRMVEPDYKMLWSEDIPVITLGDEHKVKITLVAGELYGKKAVSPTKDSWASNKDSNLSIQIIEMDAKASYTFPKTTKTMNRSIYHYHGNTALVENEELSRKEYIYLEADKDVTIKNPSNDKIKIFLLESEPINEPIIAYGPFVMTTKEEIKKAYDDYQRTQFGGWPFNEQEVAHDKNMGRFAEYPDGRVEKP